MSNRCRTLLLSDYNLNKAHTDLHKTLNFIAKDEGLKYRSIFIYEILSKYHYNVKQKDSAKYYAYKAKNLADNYYKDDVLGALLTVTKVEDDSIALNITMPI